MKQKLGLIALVLGFVFLMVGAYVIYDKYAAENAPEQLAVLESSTTAAPTETESSVETTTETTAETSTATPLAPDFTVYDTEGNPVRLSDFFGKPIVLNFWASWCGPCQSEMPDFDEAYQTLKDEVHFLMVNMTDGSYETVESASGFIAQQGYVFPVFYDTDSDAATAYGAYSLPTTYFINAEGIAIAQATGAIDAETLQRGIDMIK